MPMHIYKHKEPDPAACEYLDTIKDPVQQYAMRMNLTLECQPEHAAAAAIAHFRIHDPEGKLAKALSVFIETELKKLNKDTTGEQE